MCSTSNSALHADLEPKSSISPIRTLVGQLCLDHHCWKASFLSHSCVVFLFFFFYTTLNSFLACYFLCCKVASTLPAAQTSVCLAVLLICLSPPPPPPPLPPFKNPSPSPPPASPTLGFALPGTLRIGGHFKKPTTGHSLSLLCSRRAGGCGGQFLMQRRGKERPALPSQPN